ncbi:phage head morphogenesis protein [Acinetobacter sp. RIT698]|uniref:phage head morphogenesis protein n=1 Tax=Acinetobacter sp. RIT698 TaxID=2666192 RepID=UPI0012ACED4C|nr:phage minor head protein [Acinetobacter sp. RIT698]MRT38771.1 phage head morphogenesis protein [Acinetobacter sp. RIT698]
MTDYVEALKYARSRNVVLPEEFYLLDLKTRHYSATVSRLASIDQIKTVLELVNKSTENGSTFDEFKKLIADEGIELSDHHLANIYRTNMQMAYAHGRWTQQQANKESRPYLMYVAINDSRVRPTHLKLNNIIRHIDDPFWTLYYPPWDFMCRCHVIALTKKQAEKYGITSDEDLPEVARNLGWSFNPATWGSNLNEVLDQKIADNLLDLPYSSEILDIKNTALLEQDVEKEIVNAFKPLKESNRIILDDFLDTVIVSGKDIAPSAPRFVVELAAEDENLTELLKDAVIKKGIDRKSKSIWDWMNDSFQSMLGFAKNLKNKLTGNNIKGFDSLSLQKGNVIGIQTPTLFKTAENAGKTITILDMKGHAIDLSKIQGLDGYLLASDLNLEVIDITESEVILKKTEERANRMFIANSTLYVI